ncbi:MAG: hypothetical protein HQL05_14350 [Nitrospirae bacterium]|uniref:hypothetical protein n=1 Tax=Candidatus Magnetobacterium casense TaxID=1455061 RepID=UPI00058EEFF5|nr:hypothetical protein [Candidatus Magnetobacterium casensis]MBF0338997.1 hypothetical protein [Nitrospirota bacterium]
MGKELSEGNKVNAYEMAKEGGKHYGFFQNYQERPIEELQKSVSSIKKQIANHYAKIQNPQEHIKGFDRLDLRRQEYLVESKWPSDIKRLNEQLEILEGVILSRL